jgi:ABC-type sulfate transport system permease component
VAVAAAALQALADVMVEAPGGFPKTVRGLLMAAVVGSFSGHMYAPWR